MPTREPRPLSGEARAVLRELERHPVDPDHVCAVDDYVLAYHPEFGDEVVVGRVVEVDEDGEGQYQLWLFGTYQTRKPLWDRMYRAGWLDLADNKVMYSTPKRKSFVKFERWFPRSSVILPFVPIQGRGCVRVPSEAAKTAAVVRDLTIEANSHAAEMLAVLVQFATTL